MAEQLEGPHSTPNTKGDLFARRQYLLDLSIMGDLPNWKKDAGVSLLVPQSFDLMMVSRDFDPVLAEMIRSTSPKMGKPKDHGERSPNTLILEQLRTSYLTLRAAGVIKPIPEQRASPELVAALPGIVRQAEQVSWKSVTPIRARWQYLITILEHSRVRGVAILMRGKNTINRLIGKMNALELPSKADGIVKRKQEFTNRCFQYTGGKATKVFIGILLAAGGIAIPPIGVAGLAFAFVDP